MTLHTWVIGGAVLLVAGLLAAVLLAFGRGSRAGRPGKSGSRRPAQQWVTPPPQPARAPPPRTSSSPTEPAPTATAPDSPGNTEKPFECGKLNRPVPPILVGFRLIREWDLDRAHRNAILAMAKEIPRPPSLLPELLKQNSIDDYSPREFANRIKGDAVLAARILSTVNSPFYGLADPIESVDHAVIYLGYNMVKRIALRVALEQSFKTHDPKVREVYHGLWQASSIAGELAFRLAQQLKLGRADLIATNAVLTFLSQFATISLHPRWAKFYHRHFDLFLFTSAEQDQLHANSALLGSLLAREWNLPETNQLAIAHNLNVMVTPVTYAEPESRAEQALIFACARIGEFMVFAGQKTLADLDFCAMKSPTFFYLPGYLELPELQGFYPALQEDRLLQALPKL